LASDPLQSRPNVNDMKQDIPAIVAEIDRQAKAKNYRISKLQEIRKKLKNMQRLPNKGIFKVGSETVQEAWACHWGGRTELQFEVSIDDKSDDIEMLQFGVGFSFKTSRTITDIGPFKDKVDRFNYYIKRDPTVCRGMRMVELNRGKYSGFYKPKTIRPALVVLGNECWLFKRHPLANFDYEEILEVFDKLLPLYKYVETESPNLDVDIHDVAAVEGRRRLVLHLQRERNPKLVRSKKLHAASLECEVCRFSFGHEYGTAASKYCEVHHLLPLSDVQHTTLTRMEDLAILCSNCHRVVHLRNPPYTLDEVRRMRAK